ncbi:multiple inositol polyphosphate phosphatase 1-like [Plodia interpunctella]|uniref:multiple inositol polyphosphate phosphatase 1-like n=1 Tax=Plodia interpunctella TaxID=58824 RepID=UPI002367CCC1|nr:multiple inositol polyphosphate phosphatase 1-like [Plodia interpunctella]
MKVFIISIFFYILQYQLNVSIAELKSNKNEIVNHLGTRTPYRFRFNKNYDKIKYSKCKDSKIWMIVRHGTRLPSAKDILGMNTTLHELKHLIILQNKLGRGDLNEEQVTKFEKWSSNINVEEEKFLTLEGQDEMILLAERTRKRFPNVIKNKYDNSTFLFRFTATQRAHQSARYFTKGLFTQKDAQNVVFAPATKVDHILRFYKHCDKWQKQVKQNPDTYKEQKIFGRSIEMNHTLDSVTKRLGLNRPLTLGEVTLMYKVCGYETSWNKFTISPWCSAFDKNTVEILEYYHDLKHYWIDGYGHNLTYRQACLALQTMFKMFRSDREPFATFLFAHSGTLLKILTHLQLFKPDHPLTGDAMDKGRSWKASYIDCFASNLAFVLYKCKDGDHVLTLHQERPIILPMCDKELCPLQQLEDFFYDTIHKCDFADLCNLDKDEKDKSSQ